jgi:8-oxo-dGTP diphosphatase
MKTVEVVAALIKDNNKILATRKSYGEFKDMWEFPGGKIEKGETRKEALRREIKEELEVDILIDEFLTTVEYDYLEFHLIMHCYICSIMKGKMHFNDHNAFMWIDETNINELKWLPADILVISKIKW